MSEETVPRQEATLLETLQRESNGRDLLRYAVYKVSDSDRVLFLREFLDFLNPSGDPRSQRKIYDQTRRRLFLVTTDPSVSNRDRDSWIEALSVVDPAVGMTTLTSPTTSKTVLT